MQHACACCYPRIAAKRGATPALRASPLCGAATTVGTGLQKVSPSACRMSDGGLMTPLVSTPCPPTPLLAWLRDFSKVGWQGVHTVLPHPAINSEDRTVLNMRMRVLECSLARARRAHDRVR